MKKNFYHKTSKQLLKEFQKKPIRDSKGRIIHHAPFQNTKSNPVDVIPPQRKWFQTTRSIGQSEVDQIEETKRIESPYEVLLQRGKVPFSIFNAKVKNKLKPAIRKVKEKRCKVIYESFEEMKKGSNEAESERKEPKDENWKLKIKGQSKRIWNELHKVLDSSDVIAHVIDARDPGGTRCECVVNYMKNEGSHKHLVYILNKVDLVPSEVTAQNMKILSKERPTVAYHANSLRNYYGKNNLISIFKQFAKLLKKKSISIGFVGYPNVGKSSIINTLRDKKVSSVAPVPGETQTWKYVALTKGIYLIDSPGIVPTGNKDALLNGAVRIEKIDDTEELVDMIIERAKKVMESVYKIDFNNQDDFLEKYCIKFGRIMKGNVLDIEVARKQILKDWMDGKLPYYKLLQPTKNIEVTTEVK